MLLHKLKERTVYHAIHQHYGKAIWVFFVSPGMVLVIFAQNYEEIDMCWCTNPLICMEGHFLGSIDSLGGYYEGTYVLRLSSGGVAVVR